MQVIQGFLSAGWGLEMESGMTVQACVKARPVRTWCWAERIEQVVLPEVKCKEEIKEHQKCDRSDLEGGMPPRMDFILQGEEVSAEEREVTNAHSDSQG